MKIKTNISYKSHISRAHEMSSMPAVMLHHCCAHEESCSDVCSFKGINTIYENYPNILFDCSVVNRFQYDRKSDSFSCCFYFF